MSAVHPRSSSSSSISSAKLPGSCQGSSGKIDGMATDVEESDTDEHEKPGPAKRQKVQGLEEQASQLEAQPQSSTENPVVVVDEEEDRRSREKLRSWQTCQVIRGFMDNTINSVLENYSMSPSDTFEDPWYCLFRGNRMEDTAVSAAIRNHGLMRSLDINHFSSLVEERVPNVPQSSETASESVAAMSSEAVLLTNLNAASTSNEGTWLDNTYDSDHQQDFLDRAVAEAIKKKGLSTLSVDYG